MVSSDINLPLFECVGQSTCLYCQWIRGIGLNDVNIVPTDFSSNLGLDGCFVADEAEDNIRWVFGDLADELELGDEVFVLVTAF